MPALATGLAATGSAAPSALRARREAERRRLRDADAHDIGAVLPHLRADPLAARALAADVTRALDDGRVPRGRRGGLIARGRTLRLGTFESTVVIAAVEHRARPRRITFWSPRRRRFGVGRLGTRRLGIRRWWRPIVAAVLAEITLLMAWLHWR